MYEERFYRKWISSKDLISFEVIEKETDLFVSAEKDLSKETKRLVLKYRSDLEGYIKKRPIFKDTLLPLELTGGEPPIVREMIEAAKIAKVGPMASVAGAIADFVGKGLLEFSKEVIVENGGDIFIKTSKERLFGVYAGASSFSGRIALKIRPRDISLGVCTTSATVGPSLSLGNTDATVVISKKATLADAFATTIGNAVKIGADLEKGIDLAKKFSDILGVMIIIKEKIAIYGDIEIVNL